MLLVLDGSAALEICLAKAGSGLLAGHEAIAPPLIHSEVLSSLRGLAWRREISEDVASKAVERLETVPIRLEQPAGHLRRAWDLALALGWAKTYDAEYVALAVHHGCPLLTIDARLRRGAGHIVQIVGPTEL
jgi:predicted nucleic acid-binding protein